MSPLLMQQNQNAPDDFPLAQTLVVARPNDVASDIDWALDAFAARTEHYALYARYLEGDHRRFWRIKDGDGEFAGFLRRVSYNFCPRVVGALADRLKLTGFVANSPVAADEGTAMAAWNTWEDRRLARYANTIHTYAVGHGDAYLLIWPDANGRSQFYVHRANQMVLRYDGEEPERPVFAARLWRDGRRYRINLYYGDRIEKYRTRADGDAWPKAAAFEEFQPENDTRWPVDNPYDRVPVFHFAFEGGIGEPGTSILAPVLPIQDDINVAAATRAVVREYQGWPLRYIFGLAEESEIVISPDKLLALENPQAQAGQFPAASLDPYNTNIKENLDALSGVTGIPPHLLHKGLGTPPSGEALRTAEAPLASRVEDTQIDFGDVWEQAIPFALRIDGDVGDGNISAVWQSAYTKPEREHTETVAVKVKDLGVSQAQGQRELGYSKEQVTQMRTEREMETTTATESFTTAFNRV